MRICHPCTADSRDVDELVASMTRDLIYWRSYGNIYGDGTKCSLIYKVLQCIRTSDPNAYEPRVLSIGPYHHGVPSLSAMEKEKWLCLDYVLKLNSRRRLHDYLVEITALEREVRISYSENSIMTSSMFVEMILLDSCFILVCLNGIGVKMQADVHEAFPRVQDEVITGQNGASMVEIVSGTSFRNNEDFERPKKRDMIDTQHHDIQGNIVYSCDDQNQENLDQGEQWYNSSAVYDLLLFENQIPFFVVSKIYELLIDSERTADRVLTDNLSKFIEGILLHFPLAIQDTNRPKDFDHLLHLCYLYFKPSRNPQRNYKTKKRTHFQTLLFWPYKFFGNNVGSQENEENQPSHAHSEELRSVNEFQRWRRAEQYHDAGVEFKDMALDEHKPHSLLDIDFRNGVLYIPCLPIDDKSATLFRNLVAFEQSCPALGNDIASYVYFLSHLISVPDDVALLARKGVIVHQLDSDEEVSTLFTKLFDYVLFDSSGEHYLRSLCQTMESHYQNRVNRWMAWLWHKHFGNPWLGFTAFASVVMVLCSIGQTVLAFLSYRNM